MNLTNADCKAYDDLYCVARGTYYKKKKQLCTEILK